MTAGWLEGASGTGDTYLPDMIKVLWPDPVTRIDLARWAPADGRRVYAAVPSATRPKVLVPADSGRAAAAAVRSFKSTQSRRERAVLGGLAAMFRLGAGRVLPDRFAVADSDSDLESYLSDQLGRRLRVSLHVSAPRAVRKPVVQLIDPGGRTFAFAKLGIDEFTSRLVRTEADNLGLLSEVTWRVLAVPTLLHASTWRGHPMLVQSAFARAPGAARDATVLSAAFGELARSRGTEVRKLSESTFWTRLRRRVDELDASAHRTVLADSLEVLARRHGDQSLEFGCWHGDWTPWNMNVTGGRVRVWDWEKFEPDVPVGFDPLHYRVQDAIVAHGRPAVDAFLDLVATAPQVLAGVTPREPAALLVWLYAATLATTYLEDGELSAGNTPGSRVDAWLEPTLTRAASAAATLSPETS